MYRNSIQDNLQIILIRPQALFAAKTQPYEQNKPTKANHRRSGALDYRWDSWRTTISGQSTVPLLTGRHFEATKIWSGCQLRNALNWAPESDWPVLCHR